MLRIQEVTNKGIEIYIEEEKEKEPEGIALKMREKNFPREGKIRAILSGRMRDRKKNASKDRRLQSKITQPKRNSKLTRQKIIDEREWWREKERKKKKIQVCAAKIYIFQ